MHSRRYNIRGSVQGVWYRATLSRHANEAGFHGYVRNLPDGSVEAAVSCADESCFERFERLLWKGSPLSRVDSVTYDTIDERFEGAFEVR